MSILAGDVGGTKTNLALYSPVESGLPLRILRSFRSSGYPSLEAILEEFLEKVPVKVILDETATLLGAARLAQARWKE